MPLAVLMPHPSMLRQLLDPLPQSQRLNGCFDRCLPHLSSIREWQKTLPIADPASIEIQNQLPPTPPREVLPTIDLSGNHVPMLPCLPPVRQVDAKPSAVVDATAAAAAAAAAATAVAAVARFEPSNGPFTLAQSLVMHHPAISMGGRPNPQIALTPNLQIPTSISACGGNLAEFAAEITGLLWFESMHTLRQIEDAAFTPDPAPPLMLDSLAKPGFVAWVASILSTTNISQNVTLLALFFIYRLKKAVPHVQGRHGSEYRLLTVALMLGNKFLDDNTYTNKTWAEVSGITVEELHVMEVEFLSNMRYNLFTSESQWADWHKTLRKFWNYFNRAARPMDSNGVDVFLSGASALRLPTCTFAPALPSPVSTHNSPPNFPLPQSANQHLTVPQAPMLCSYVPPMEDVFSVSRKRCHEDVVCEPPAKRVSRSVPSNYAQMQAQNPVTNAVRLPVPSVMVGLAQNHVRPAKHVSLPYSTGVGDPLFYQGAIPAQVSTQVPAQVPTQIPVQIPSQASLQPVIQPVIPPTIQPTIQSSVPSMQTVQTTSMQRRDAANRQPYLSRPTQSQPLQQPLQLPRQPVSYQSPSFYLNMRTSPYRPVRGVDALVVQSSPTQYQNATRNLSWHQMHYLPLGRPMTDVRTGVVPYSHQESWTSLGQVPPANDELESAYRT